MGSVKPYVTTSGERRWEVFFRDETHRQHHKRGFETRKAARVYLAAHEVAVENGDYIDPRLSKITVGELGAQWIEGRKAIWKPSYLKSVETAWRVHVMPRWGDRPIGGIRHSEVQQWVSELARDRSATVVYRAFGILKDIYEMAISDRRIAKTPTEHTMLPRRRSRRHVFLTVEQLLALADASGEHRALILLLGFCGLRWGEATGLRVSDIDFGRNRIRVDKSATRIGSEVVVGSTKTGQSREVSMSRIVADALRVQVAGKGPDELVFDNGSGGYLRQQSAADGNRGWFAKAVRVSGVPRLRIHDLRHTAASIAISSGANPKYVQRMLGHSSAKMTLDTYSDLFDGDIDRVADNIDDLVAGIGGNDDRPDADGRN